MLEVPGYESDKCHRLDKATNFIQVVLKIGGTAAAAFLGNWHGPGEYFVCCLRQANMSSLNVYHLSRSPKLIVISPKRLYG